MQNCEDKWCGIISVEISDFPFFLRDKAGDWLKTLHDGFIDSWKKLPQMFLDKFDPPRKTLQARCQIIHFTQKRDKHMFET